MRTPRPRASPSRRRSTASPGCGIGEVLGLGGATLLGLGNLPSIALGIVLAYAFGFGLTLVPLLRAGMPFARASGVTLAAETLSITTMEIVDNAVVLAIPGAMDAASPTSCSGRAWQFPSRLPS